jgi:hypothetical protein
MRIALGAFARSGIESQLGTDIGGAVQAALCHYAGKLKSGRPPLSPPGFLPEGAAQDGKDAFDLAVDPETEALLEREAAKLGTDVSRLAAHSVLVYLAELDFLAAPSRPV